MIFAFKYSNFQKIKIEVIHSNIYSHDLKRFTGEAYPLLLMDSAGLAVAIAAAKL